MTLVFPLVGLLAVSAFTADTPLDRLLKTVEQRYNRTDTLQVLFQYRYIKTGRAQRPESGVLDLRKPRKMRWEYSEPKGKLAVCDGKTFWTSIPGEDVEKLELKDSDIAPFGFLLGKLNFDKEFRNLKSAPEGADTRVAGEPKTDNLPYSGVEFLIAPDGRVKEVKITRFDNSLMVYTFDQEKAGIRLDDKLFQFQMPKGAGK